jgi:peptidylprolyl isomerase
MNIYIKQAIVLFFIFSIISCKGPVSNENTTVSMKTALGTIEIQLYDDTPLHRDNFIKLVKSDFYDGISFHRVIKDFMIQAGDPLTRSVPFPDVNDTINSYTIPAEIRPHYFHRKGALAAAREGNAVNPEMRSSGTQFYIVQGIKYDDSALSQEESRVNNNLKQALFRQLIVETTDSLKLSGNPFSEGQVQEIASTKMFRYLTENEDYSIPEDHRKVYSSTGGVPRLDGTYTVFGQVTEGLDVVDKIASESTDATDRPLNDIKILKIRINKK